MILASTTSKKAPNHGGARSRSGPPKKDSPVADDYQDYTKARAAHEYWKAQLAEQEFQRKAGELLDRAQVEQAAATVLATIAQTLRSIPDNMERVAGLTPEQAEECERIVDSLCLSLHDKLKELGGW